MADVAAVKAAIVAAKTANAEAKTADAGAKAVIGTTVIPKKNQNLNHYVSVACLHLSTRTTPRARKWTH